MKKRLVITTMACAMLFAGCGVTLENKADNKTDSSVKTEVQENTKEENTEKENTKKELSIIKRKTKTKYGRKK